MQAVYRVEGQRVDTGPDAAGPWNPAMQHGAAPAALLAWLAERCETTVPMRLARLTLDLLRPVPIAALEIRSEIVRQGRKILLVAMSLSARNVEGVRASALKVLVADPLLPENLHESRLDVPGPDCCRELNADERIKSPFLAGVSARIAVERQRRSGPAGIWFRAKQTIIEGALIGPATRAAVSARFCQRVLTEAGPTRGRVRH